MSNEPVTIIDTDTCRMTGDVTVYLSDGRACKFLSYDIHKRPLETLMEHAGLVTKPTDRVDVMQYGRKVGELPSFWTPAMARSTSPMYDYRDGDLTLVDGKWEAHSSVGGGDLDLLIGFVRKGEVK